MLCVREMKRDLKLEKELTDALRGYPISVDWVNETYKLTARKGEKSVVVTWPYPLMEVYFDFIENDKETFSESVEFYEGESPSELCDYLTYVIKRFLNSPSRIETRGKLLKRSELQVSESGKWVSVFD